MKRPLPSGFAAKAAQQRLAEEVASQRESLLQACWAHQLWRGGTLRTSDGRTLEVIAPGWLNRGAGPDFTEARLLLDGTEHWGDVEIHVNEREWWAHGHQNDPAYGRVILHVVLRRGERPALQPVSGGIVPVFETGSVLSTQVLETMHDPEALLERYETLPGRCGLRAARQGADALARVIAHASETRARNKAEAAAPVLAAAGEEEGLFQLMFRYLGYRPFAPFFRSLAERFPLATLTPLFDRPMVEARTAILARWFGAAGLLEHDPGDPGGPLASLDPGARSEYAALRDCWLELGMPPLVENLPKGGSRPWNAAERRMVGMFHHLHAMARGGWLKEWLAFLLRLDRLRNHPNFPKEVNHTLNRIFATPETEPWRFRVTFAHPPKKRAARLIGPERVAMLMANAVLPFFLARARRDGDTELEKVLYRLYLVLPPESANHRTRFMEHRMGPFSLPKRSLRTHQGLLQIHTDFCASFHHGCEQCGLPDLIGR
ncbi:MAG: DUF2851 family protein [bacterium]